jgi:hypothetical protein
MTQIIEKDLCYEITGLCFQTQKKLGRFCREIQYANELEQLFKNKNWDYQREYEIKKLTPDSPISSILGYELGIDEAAMSNPKNHSKFYSERDSAIEYYLNNGWKKVTK